MNDAKEQVWTNFRGELRRRRMRRRATTSGVLVILLVAASWWLAQVRPAEDFAAPAMAEVPRSSLPEGVSTGPQLAVFVQDGDGMRLELVDAEALADTSLSLSLEPVVWTRESW